MDLQGDGFLQRQHGIQGRTRALPRELHHSDARPAELCHGNLAHLPNSEDRRDQAHEHRETITGSDGGNSVSTCMPTTGIGIPYGSRDEPDKVVQTYVMGSIDVSESRTLHNTTVPLESGVQQRDAKALADLAASSWSTLQYLPRRERNVGRNIRVTTGQIAANDARHQGQDETIEPSIEQDSREQHCTRQRNGHECVDGDVESRVHQDGRRRILVKRQAKWAVNDATVVVQSLQNASCDDSIHFAGSFESRLAS